MLVVDHISKTFEKGTVNEHCALKDLSITLQDGDFVTIVGSNGAGKSTLFNAISGSFLTDAGKIVLDEEDITFKKEHERAKIIGRVFQDPMRGTAPNMTIEENLALAYTRSGKSSSVFSRAITKQKTEFFRENLARYKMGIEDRMKTKIGLLSGGQRQVVTLLMCTLTVPKLLLLDEHTAALDPETAVKVMDITKTIVAENQITTMMITHNLQQALDTGNRTIMMDAGEIVFDVAGEERSGLTVPDLIRLFAEKRNRELTNDRMMLG
jgi:putative tryptophan/tyrosine transport system ATP-binding protein